MNADGPDFEKLGQFYLGRTVPADGTRPETLLYDSRDLVTHGVVLGMTGSGKTGLCLAILEEAALDDIPVLAIDPKGDIANLLLQFPELDAASFRPWIHEEDAARKGRTPDEHAAAVAETWRAGLAEWGQGPGRIRALREKSDVRVYTPGSRAGIPVSILGSLAAPPAEVRNDGELFAERVEGTAAALLGLVGIEADAAQSREAVLLSLLIQHAWRAGDALTLEALVHRIQRPPFDKVGVVDLASFLPEKPRQELALRFNNLLASPGFASWLEGEPLDIAAMLHGPDGKPRTAIFSTAHLGDADRMFFTSLLLNQLTGWMRTQRGTTSLRALFYMDEIFGYLPPTANPPSKRPMLTLLKQGRAFGLGCLLATQNPVDLDYKALSNIGTWFLGRLQTERDKLRVLDGLQGALAAAGHAFDRGELDRLLSGLAQRTFLMNNVHESGPVLFQVRWVMSYLAGPLARSQIQMLMDEKRGEVKTPEDSPEHVGVSARARPVVAPGIGEWFGAAAAGDVLVAHLLREGEAHFAHTKGGIEGRRVVREAVRIDGADEPFVPPADLREEVPEGVAFAETAGRALSAAFYREAEKEFAERLYREERVRIFYAPALGLWSEIGELERDFRARLIHAAHEARDAALEKIRAAAARKLATLEGRLRTAEARLAQERTEAGAATVQAGTAMLGGLLGAVLGRRRSLGGNVNPATRAYKQHQDIRHAEARVADVSGDITTLREALDRELAEVAATFDPQRIPLETVELKPRRADVRVTRVGLAWLPAGGRGS